MQLKLLLDVVTLLNKYSIKHCLIFGTLLGVVRDKALMPWDSIDVDIAIFSQPWRGDSWHDFVVDVYKLNYRIVEIRYNYMCIKPDLVSSLHVDFYYFSIYDDMFYSYKGPLMEFFFNKRFFDELDSIDFLGTSMSIPKYVEEALECTYGEDWRTPKTADEMYATGKPYHNTERVSDQYKDFISYTYVEPVFNDDVL